MRSKPRWLTADELIELNQYVVAETGEPFQVLNRGTLEGAANRPLNQWLYDDEDDAVTLAVTLLFAIARAHAFQQGNKRTAFQAFLIFLRLAGYAFDCQDTEYLGRFIVAVVEREVSEAEFERVIRKFVVEDD